MTIDPVIARRTALTAGLAGVGAVALAACGSSGSDSTRQPAGGATSAAGGASSAAGAATSAAGGATSSAPAASSSTASTSSAAGGSGGTEVASLADIKVGGAISAKLDGKPIIVSRPTSSTVACFSAICTHQGCTVAPSGDKLDCPCHGSVFNAFTGAVINPPAPSPLHKIAVTVSGGKVVATG